MLMRGLRLSCIVCLFMCCSCGVQRTMTVQSDPEGALVVLNGEEVGRTPVAHDFLWYGDYTVELRKSGYETLKTHTWVGAPWWQIVPIDFFAEFVPGGLHDRQRFSYEMQPATTQPIDKAQVLERAEYYRSQLEGAGTTRPTTKPARRAATTQVGSEAPDVHPGL